MLHLILLTQLVELVTSHASMIMPPSRNAIDSNLPAWHNSNISNPPETGTIEPYNCRCTNGTEPFCNAGQACFWFSQGCTIGCSKCDGLGARSVYFFEFSLILNFSLTTFFLHLNLFFFSYTFQFTTLRSLPFGIH